MNFPAENLSLVQFSKCEWNQRACTPASECLWQGKPIEDPSDHYVVALLSLAKDSDFMSILL